MNPPMSIVAHRFSTPLGKMMVCATPAGVCLLEFLGSKRVDQECNDLVKLLQTPITVGQNMHTQQCEAELGEYFAHKRTVFQTPLHTPGTPFQQKVWTHLTTIPFGLTRSYSEQAQSLGQPRAIRAVAHANGTNRVAIMIPCHRVIGKNGELVGYGGGLQRKSWLLEHEGGLQKKSDLFQPE